MPPVIDVHTHIVRGHFPPLGPEASLSPEQLVDTMNRNGVDVSVLLPLEAPDSFGELYLTDCIAALARSGARIETVGCADPRDAIGMIGGGRRKPKGQVDVALIQSLVRHGEVTDLVADYGHLVVDECHHLSAASFELVARRAKARYVLGLSATVARKDGHHPIIFMQCGPVRHRVAARAQAAARPEIIAACRAAAVGRTGSEGGRMRGGWVAIEHRS